MTEILSSWHSWWAVLIYLSLLTGAVLLYIRIITRLDREQLKYQQSQLDHLRQQDVAKSRELETQRKYRRLFEQSQDAILISDAKGKIVDANLAAEQLFGYSKEELGTIDYHDLFPVAEELHAFDTLVGRNGQVTDFDITVVDQKGQMRECIISATLVKDEDGNITGYQGIIRDVTQQKKMESELSYLATNLRNREQVLKKLSSAILNAQEKERNRISRELHDEVGQAITAISLSLQVLRRQYSDDQEIQTHLDYCQKIAQHTSEKIHNFSRELRSTVLEDLGLQAALESQIHEFTRQTKVNVILDFNLDENLLPDELQLNLFRIVQEGLNNVAKHASAGQVRIVIDLSDGEIQLRLIDNGRGFNQSLLDTGHPMGLGILGMEERTLLFGGRMQIHSNPGQGTELHIQIPV
ncbi:MAG: PAS domain S-box protein [FCB group bacterium]|nr:PAS domain S-box protein [FCB group bacterium]